MAKVTWKEMKREKLKERNTKPLQLTPTSLTASKAMLKYDRPVEDDMSTLANYNNSICLSCPTLSLGQCDMPDIAHESRSLHILPFGNIMRNPKMTKKDPWYLPFPQS